MFICLLILHFPVLLIRGTAKSSHPRRQLPMCKYLGGTRRVSYYREDGFTDPDRGDGEGEKTPKSTAGILVSKMEEMNTSTSLLLCKPEQA